MYSTTTKKKKKRSTDPPSEIVNLGLVLQNIYIIIHEDPAIQGNSDEPYIMNIGFRSTLGNIVALVTQNVIFTMLVFSKLVFIW